MNKRVFSGLSLVLLLVLAAPAVTGVAHSKLVGTWSGVGKGLSPERGFYDIPLTMIIMEVQGALFRGTITATPPGGTVSTIPFSGILALPENEISIALGHDPDGDEPMFTWMKGKVAGKTCRASWHNLASGDSGTIKFKKI
jgi:hypothetical protein